MRLATIAGALALLCLTACAPALAKPELNSSTTIVVGKIDTPLRIAPPRARMADLVIAAARRHGVPPALAYAIAETESHFDPRARNGHAYGLMQVQLGTAHDAGCRGSLLDPRVNADCGARILAVLLRDGRGSWREAARHYNCGRFARAGVGHRYAALVLQRARRVAA